MQCWLYFVGSKTYQFLIAECLGTNSTYACLLLACVKRRRKPSMHAYTLDTVLCLCRELRGCSRSCRMSTSHLLTSRMSWKLEVCTTLWYICTGKPYIFDRGGPPVIVLPVYSDCMYYEVQNFIIKWQYFREAPFTCTYSTGKFSTPKCFHST